MTLFWGAEKECLKIAHNWRGLSQERASQLKVDFEKANAAAGAGFTGVARLCYTCRAKCNKPKHSGRNGCKGQGKGKGVKWKIDEAAFEGPPISDLVEVQCEVCSSSVRSDDLRILRPYHLRVLDCSTRCDMACKSCLSIANKRYRKECPASNLLQIRHRRPDRCSLLASSHSFRSCKCRRAS